jgi:hypothetical protein
LQLACAAFEQKNVLGVELRAPRKIMAPRDHGSSIRKIYFRPTAEALD